MIKELTREQYLRAVDRRPRFQTLSVAKDGVTLRDPLPPMCYWFERNEVAEVQDTGRYVRNPTLATVTLVVDGTSSVIFYLNGRQVESCTFSYRLYPRQLARAVTAMRRAGLGRFVRPAADWAIRSMPQERRPVLEKALKALVRSLRR
jgi:hypothetical protein